MSQKTKNTNKLKAYSLSAKTLFVGTKEEVKEWTLYWQEWEKKEREQEIVSAEGNSLWIRGGNEDKHYSYAEALKGGKLYILDN